MINRILKSWSFWVAVIGLIVCLAAAGLLSARLAQAAPTAPTTTFSCTPDIIVSANVRVVAHCNPGYDNTIYWFAYPTSDSGNASRMLSLFESARATGSTVTFYFEPNDTSGTSYGCLASDCRAIWAATMP